MRTARIKETERKGYYHVMSRIIQRQSLLGPEEKEKFRKVMRAAEAFSGVRLLTYAILNNHFHMLLEVPEAQEISDEELIRRMGYLYEPFQVKQVAGWLKEYREAGQTERAERLRRRYTRRMNDLSEYMKTVKQKFTQWYNRRGKRRGTLWEERFKSVMIEPSRARAGQWNNALLTMAAYIDLNAVRAGLVEDPKEYRYSGYGEACGGGKEARAGLSGVYEGYGEERWAEVARQYREQLYVRGEQTKRKAGFSREEVEAVLAEGGKLTLGEALRCRVRYFSDGVVLGGKAYVEEVFERHREEFGVKRKTGARPLRHGEFGGLCTMRDLRLAPITA